MKTQKELKISEENYEMSIDLYKLFKKYKNYDGMKHYNFDELLKTKEELIGDTNVEGVQVAMVEYKEPFFKKL